MALSEQEQRILDEIESALYREDPHFGRSASPRPASPVLFKALALGLLGLCVLVGGIALSQTNLWFVALGAVGFLIMFGAGFLYLRASRGDAPSAAPKQKKSRKSAPSANTRASSIEESFRRRFE